MPEYASIRLMLVWRMAPRLPSVIESAAITPKTRRQFSGTRSAAVITRSASAKPANFEPTDMNAVTGVGAPS